MTNIITVGLRSIIVTATDCIVIGFPPWVNIMTILDEKDGGDTELLVYAMTLVNKVSRIYVLGLSKSPIVTLLISCKTKYM